VLLARINASGEARNVPRELGRGDAVDGIAVAWTGSDHVVAWSEATPAGPGTYVVVTDARGVPRGPARRVLDGTGPRLAYLPSSGITVLAAQQPNGQGVVASIDPFGAVVESADWPAGARTLVAGTGGSSAYGVTLTQDTTGATVPLVTRWTPGATPVQTLLAYRVASGSTVASLIADRFGLVAAIDEPAGRELLVRIAPDGSTTLLGVRPGSRGTLVLSGDGAILSVGHEPARPALARLAWVQLSCPRPPATAAPGAPVASGSQGDAGAAPPDAGAGRIQ
jgi:hypothetical protein